MRPCTRVGLDVTWKCNWNCLHCFYRHGDQLHTNWDAPFEQLLAKVDTARAGGIDHVVLVGYGEPSLYKRLDELAAGIRERGLTWSMITNGATSLAIFQRCYNSLGIDHLHISSHGNLEAVSERQAATAAQRKLKAWLHAEGLPFRTNVTLQQATYQQVTETIAEDIGWGSRHLVLLGFLPHYEHQTRVGDVAVHPAELRPHIEAAAQLVLDAGRLLTIRYHPLCHLDPRYWPYVVNARYVYADPWEWNYELQATDWDALWAASIRLGESVANTDPCRSCSAYRHCGGWNRHNVEAFAGADLVPITLPPDQYASVWDQDGGLHDLNPANHERGYFGARHPDPHLPAA